MRPLLPLNGNSLPPSDAAPGRRGRTWPRHASDRHTAGLILAVETPTASVPSARSPVPSTAWTHQLPTMGHHYRPEGRIDGKTTPLHDLPARNHPKTLIHTSRIAIGRLRRDNRNIFILTEICSQASNATRAAFHRHQKEHANA